MTHSEANRLLSAPLFNKNELALIKLLVFDIAGEKVKFVSEINMVINIYLAFRIFIILNISFLFNHISYYF